MPYPPWDQVLVGLGLVTVMPSVLRTPPAHPHGQPPDTDARPPRDLTVIGYEDAGFPILSWQGSPDDRSRRDGCYGVRYRQLAPGPYGIVVPGSVWVSSAGPAHRTVRDVYGYCIFGGTYEVAVSFVPPGGPASAWSEPIQVEIPEAF